MVYHKQCLPALKPLAVPVNLIFCKYFLSMNAVLYPKTPLTSLNSFDIVVQAEKLRQYQ